MEEEQKKARTDALAFLKRHRTGVLATVSREWQPHASFVHYVSDDDFNIYFLTLTSTRKFDALSAHPEVAFTIATEDVPQTLQIEGTAMDISASPEGKGKAEDIFRVLNANQYFYAPVAKLDPAVSSIVWIQPKWIRWADYAFGPDGTNRVLKEIEIKA
jgi:general stress protein 26